MQQTSNQQKLSDLRRDVIGGQTSDLTLVFFIWAEQTWFSSMPQKLNFYKYLLEIAFQITISSSSMALNCPSPLY